MAIKASIFRARGAVVAVGAVALALFGAIGNVLGYWDLVASVRDKAPKIAVGLSWLATIPGNMALIVVFLGALAWAYWKAANPGGRASAKRLNVLVARAIDNIVNEPNLPSDVLFVEMRKWEEDALEAMEEEGCTETEIASVRHLGNVEVIKVVSDGIDVDCAQWQRIAYTKAMRVRAAAARIESL